MEKRGIVDHTETLDTAARDADRETAVERNPDRFPRPD